MTRDELAAELRRADAGLEVEPLDWARVSRHARRALLARRVVAIASVLTIFGALVAGGLAARSALEDEPERATPREARPTTPTGTPTTTAPPRTTPRPGTTSTPTTAAPPARTLPPGTTPGGARETQPPRR